MRIAKALGVSHVRCFGDSELVVQQVSGTWDANDPNMAAYRRAVDQIGGNFAGYNLEHVDRRKNEAADELSRIVSLRQKVPTGVFLDHLHSPAVRSPTEDELASPESPDSALVAAASVRPEWTESLKNLQDKQFGHLCFF